MTARSSPSGQSEALSTKGETSQDHSHLHRTISVAPHKSHMSATARRQLLTGAVRLLHRPSANQPGRYFYNSNVKPALPAMNNAIKDKGYPLESSTAGAAETKKCRFAHPSPEKHLRFVRQAQTTEEEDKSWNQQSPAEKGGPTGPSFIEKTSFCSKMNPLPSGKHRIASQHKAVRYLSQLPNNSPF
jgi:hypothetical protein